MRVPWSSSFRGKKPKTFYKSLSLLFMLYAVRSCSHVISTTGGKKFLLLIKNISVRKKVLIINNSFTTRRRFLIHWGAKICLLLQWFGLLFGLHWRRFFYIEKERVKQNNMRDKHHKQSKRSFLYTTLLKMVRQQRWREFISFLPKRYQTL